MGPKAKEKEIDPEVLLKRKFRAKCRFRALGRLVMANAYWLMEAIDEYEGVEDVKRRVEQAVRGKSRQQQLLTVADKALLNKAAADRTDLEKKYIYRIIGGLKCFKRYPNHVKKKLAAVTYFNYYGPNRVIVRQHQEAQAMYFIVSGDVSVTQLIFDELLHQYEDVEVAIMHAGDMFGEVSLLHNIPRTATVTTLGHCEFLLLMKDDFKHVLLLSVQKQWDEVRHAMSYFTYFDGLDPVASREGCIMARLKSYEINETILGDGCGIPNFVYFVLSGRVQIIESLQIVVTKRLGRQYYTLFDPYVPPEESEQDFEKKWFSAYPDLNGEKTTASANVSGMVPYRSTMDSTTRAHASSISSFRKQVERNEAKLEEHLAQISAKLSHEREAMRLSREEALKQIGEPLTPTAASPTRMSHVRLSTVNTTFGDSRHKRESLLASRVLLPPIEDGRPSVRYSVLPTPEAVAQHTGILRTYFMQVCQMNPGSTFGFGENMRDRRIIALTPVKCMLIPKIWLLQRNTANIWTRIQYYLEKKIPTKKQLFEEFVSQRRWEEYRQERVDDVVSRSKTVNYTTLHDVPYSIRMEEMYDM